MPAFWMLCVLVFSGCQSVPPDVSPGALAIASEWKLTGKLGVKTPERSGNFAFDWQQTGEQFDIALRGPLGMQIAHIYGHQQRSYLDIPDQQGLQATSPDELAALALGYSLPVSPMRYWVRGIPDPRQRAAPIEGGFRQSGWKILRLKENATGPLKIEISRPEVRLLVIAKRWSY